MMPRARRHARIAREEYALSPRSACGVVRGRPPVPVHLELGQQRGHRGCVPGLAGCHHDDQREPAPINQRVGLGREPTARPADSVIARFVPPRARNLVVR